MLAFPRPCYPPRLFHTIKVNFDANHIKKLEGLAESPHIAPLVQQLIWITSVTRDVHPGRYDQVIAWTGDEDDIKEFCHLFFLTVDAMLNLHTFASELAPLSLHPLSPNKFEIDGLIFALWPAMCRPQLRITSFRCQDPLNYMKWLNFQYESAKWGQLREFPPSFPTRPLIDLAMMFRRAKPGVPIRPGYRRPLIHLALTESPPAMPWEKPLGKLLRLDLWADSVWTHWKTSHIAEAMVGCFLAEAVNIRELSLRFRPTGTYLGPTTELKCMLPVFLACRWNFLHAIKITFATLSSPKFFIDFMENHAKTLKHVLLHQCSTNEDIVEIIRGAAEVKELKLHRFLISPSCEGRYEAQKPWIIPERPVLDFINKKDTSLDPFNEWMPSKSCNWGTVTKEAASISE
ncbi:hypothetical protein LCI18_002228 [Fusarium solani-melongenae]|uniref:Uncharacterized protein n=1 Tax=Fusarium solani subsp. cucurbitae TaxID=2747967 RepID=A0ACD3YTW0_FUSSC|nr:hypothetical protein LCI18_002228 [Fusarium solani-melongenae]